jgi:hypothetical protein
MKSGGIGNSFPCCSPEPSTVHGTANFPSGIFGFRDYFAALLRNFVHNEGSSLKMKSKILVATILLSSCLTSWGLTKSITQEEINQIRVGQTTEADLVALFGQPTTRYLGLAHITSLDWFRSVPMPIGGYVPLFGDLFGGRRIDAQQPRSSWFKRKSDPL